MGMDDREGYLVLGDISGYTSYVARVEIDHARDVLSELLELIVGQLTPVMTLSRIEGDAVFAYLPAARLSRGETLVELLESTYVAFRDRVEGIRRRTTCDCRACRAIPDLDLKFITHFGEYLIQDVAGMRDLLGPDVNLLHRLAKNGVTAATGWRGYALFSAPALARAGLPPEGLHERVESYEHVGDVRTYSLDLRARYQALAAARHVLIDAGAAQVVYTVDVPAGPAVVWDWLNDPQKRPLWMPGTSWRPELRPGGRTAPGARNHCAHGSGESIETILDWHPFDYYTADMRPGRNARMFMLMTFRLEPIAQGTRLHLYARFQTPLPDRLTRLLAPRLARQFNLAECCALLKQGIAAAGPGG